MSCGGNQVLFINFGVRTQKIRRAYLNGQIVPEFVSGCLNLNLKFRLNFKYASEHDVGFPNRPFVDPTTRPGSKVMTLDLDLDLDSFIKRAKRASSEWRSGRYLHLELPKPCELRGRI